MTTLINRILPEQWVQQIHTFFEKRAALRALRKQNRKIHDAKEIVDRSELNISRWKLFLEFRVFHGVQGDHVQPDVIHGQSLTLHFSKHLWMEEEEGSELVDELVCSDDQGRWFELTGRPQNYCWIKRINAQVGADRLAKFEDLKNLATTPLTEFKS